MKRHWVVMHDNTMPDNMKGHIIECPSYYVARHVAAEAKRNPTYTNVKISPVAPATQSPVEVYQRVRLTFEG